MIVFNISNTMCVYIYIYIYIYIHIHIILQLNNYFLILLFDWKGSLMSVSKKHIFYLPRCTLPDFSSVSSLVSLPSLSCCHRTTTMRKVNNVRTVIFSPIFTNYKPNRTFRLVVSNTCYWLK